MKWKIQVRENGSLFQALFRDVSGLPLLPGHECHCNRILNHIRIIGLAAGGTVRLTMGTGRNLFLAIIAAFSAYISAYIHKWTLLSIFILNTSLCDMLIYVTTLVRSYVLGRGIFCFCIQWCGLDY